MFDNEDNYQVWSVANKKDETRHSVIMDIIPPEKWSDNVQKKNDHWVKVTAKFSEKK